MERMKKTVISLLAGLLVLPAYTQTVTPETKAFIVEQMKDFTSTLNNVITLFEEDAIDVKTMDRLYGGDYLTVNGTKYGKLSAWIDRYYRGQLKGVEVNHTFEIRQPSIRKVSATAADRRYRVEATMKRASAIKGGGANHDYRLQDREVAFTVVVNEGYDMKIVGMEGNWEFKPVYPTYRERRTLELSEDYSNASYRSEKITFSVTSYSVQDKLYGRQGELGKETGTRQKTHAYRVESALRTERNHDEITVHVPYNSTRKPRTHTVYVYQTDSVGDMLDGTHYTVYQDKNPKRWSLEDAAFDINGHYGFNGTAGLSLMRSYIGTRWAFGLYFAFTPKLLKEWSVIKTDKHLSNSGVQTEVDGDYEIKTTYLCPQIDGYSPYIDPENEAKFENLHTYLFIQSGYYPASWLRLDLGLGIASRRETFTMSKHWDAKITEYTPLQPESGAPSESHMSYVKDTGHDLEYRGKAQLNFACRTGVDLRIPISDHVYLNLGAGYIFVPGMTEAGTADVTAGIGFTFFDF